MRRLLGTLFVIMSVSVGYAEECGLLGQQLGICKIANDLDANTKAAVLGLLKELGETRKMAFNAAQAAIKAVPGERYLQLIDKLFSGNEQEKKEAQTFLRNLANIDPEIKTQATLRFSFPGNKSFHYDYFRDQFPSVEQVRLFANTSLNLQLARSSTRSVPTLDVLKKQLTDRSTAVFDILTGPISSEDKFEGGKHMITVTFPSNFIEPYENRNIVQSHEMEMAVRERNRRVARHQLDRVRFAEQIVASILPLFQDQTSFSGDAIKTFPWNVVDGKNFLILLIDEESYNNTPDFSIFASVHTTDDPSKTLNARAPYEFKKADFDPGRNLPVNGKIGQRLYWAYQEFTGDPVLSPQKLDALNDLRSLLERWQKQNRG